jgi:hypothetical protein
MSLWCGSMNGWRPLEALASGALTCVCELGGGACGVLVAAHLGAPRHQLHPAKLARRLRAGHTCQGSGLAALDARRRHLGAAAQAPQGRSHSSITILILILIPILSLILRSTSTSTSAPRT